METLADLKAKLDAYRLQLNQVVTILVADPENAQFRQLKVDLDTVIKLTEQLIKTKEEDTAAPFESAHASGLQRNALSSSTSDNTAKTADQTASAENATVVPGVPFTVGQTVEAISGDRPYPAVVVAVSADPPECTVKYFEFEVPVVLPVAEIAKVPKGSLTAAQVGPGYVAQVKYAADQRWYDAVVDTATEHGYVVTFAAYGNQEEVPLEYIRAPLLKKEKTKDENALIAIPDNLKILPTDTEEVFCFTCYDNTLKLLKDNVC